MPNSPPFFAIDEWKDRVFVLSIRRRGPIAFGNIEAVVSAYRRLSEAQKEMAYADSEGRPDTKDYLDSEALRALAEEMP